MQNIKQIYLDAWKIGRIQNNKISKMLNLNENVNKFIHECLKNRKNTKELQNFKQVYLNEKRKDTRQVFPQH